MSNRFTDNVTPLNAATLNQFEEDVRTLPIYNAVYEESSIFFTYRISDGDFEESLKIGYTFIMIPDVSSQGTSNSILAIARGDVGDPLYWNNMNVMPTIGDSNAYARVNNDKYLAAGRPYIVKCFGRVQNNYQFIISEMYQSETITPAGQNTLGGVKIWVSDGTLYISTN